MRRAIFRRGLRYTAVKPVRHLDRTFEPGQEVVGLKVHHLRFLWRRGRIGVAGDEWTEEQVKAWRARVERDEAKAKPPVVQSAHPVVPPSDPLPKPPAAVPASQPAKVAGPRRVRG